MLTVTEAAAEAISALTAQQGAESGDSGLRFALQSMEGEGAQLALSVAPSPEDGDRVVGTDGGAKVFLEPQAAALLDDKVLDVQQDETGDVAFAVLPQQSA
ncbi:Fe-S cluster assembly iron-binding protein IscA [Amycolatopsis sulphurea]|uniref:Fe-S cluster assembly iron-binding protein IscA n=1 Tax=Amycolatopsis sulphurea TaxID=76022 RepID=A0A2A9F702_9PSEU|nr:iron-sulfur cluster biosynthesis protein [Amycolatopsis sulphurea]PFG46753.1 Fe-S cluster assembly iron-binding protein IscA [Amycolatopsis sulphurea]